MTAGELRAFLSGVSDDTPIILAKDREGNSYSPLSGCSPQMYVADSTWSGDIYPNDEEIDGEMYTKHDRAPDGALSVVCLWPVN